MLDLDPQDHAWAGETEQKLPVHAPRIISEELPLQTSQQMQSQRKDDRLCGREGRVSWQSTKMKSSCLASLLHCNWHAWRLPINGMLVNLASLACLAIDIIANEMGCWRPHLHSGESSALHDWVACHGYLHKTLLNSNDSAPRTTMDICSCGKGHSNFPLLQWQIHKKIYTNQG